MIDPLDIENFRRLLAETVDWCTANFSAANPAISLRTPALLPAGLTCEFIPANAGESASTLMKPNLWDYSVEQLAAIVDDVGEIRSALLNVAYSDIDAFSDKLHGGRIFACAVYDTTYDGMAGDLTSYFLDAGDAPPWDTWLVLVKDETISWPGTYLLSWVPPEMIAAVDAAIPTSATDCIYWASDLHSPLLQPLIDAGLIK